MKVLFIGSSGADYLYDCTLHGLYNNPKVEVTNFPQSTLMYKGIEKLSVYGHGFTIYGTLDNYISTTHDDVLKRIKKKYFDYIFFSALHTNGNLETGFTEEIFKNYKRHQIVTLDGYDDDHIRGNILDRTIYFKRELIYDNDDIFPISFAFPMEKIQTFKKEKIRKDSLVKPAWYPNKNYLYTNEQDYYEDYRSSLFGDTYKKGGWDCLRHYEIMACRCIPHFIDIDNCPVRTCTTLPKDLLKEANKLYENPFKFFTAKNKGWTKYLKLEKKIFDHFIENCTTLSLSNYIIDTISNYKLKAN